MKNPGAKGSKSMRRQVLVADPGVRIPFDDTKRAATTPEAHLDTLTLRRILTREGGTAPREGDER